MLQMNELDGKYYSYITIAGNIGRVVKGSSFVAAL